MADFGVFAKLDIARSCEHFWSQGLRQNVVPWLHFKCILIKNRWNLRRVVYGAREFDLLFGRFSLGPPYEEFQKITDFGVFAKLDIAGSCEHFWSRGLRQNVVRWLHFKRILIRRRWDLRRGVLGARDFDLHFGRFSLGPPYEVFQKMADFAVFAKLDIARNCEHFWRRGLRQNVVRWLHFNPIQTGLFWSICDWGGLLGPPLFISGTNNARVVKFTHNDHLHTRKPHTQSWLATPNDDVTVTSYSNFSMFLIIFPLRYVKYK